MVELALDGGGGDPWPAAGVGVRRSALRVRGLGGGKGLLRPLGLFGLSGLTRGTAADLPRFVFVVVQGGGYARVWRGGGGGGRLVTHLEQLRHLQFPFEIDTAVGSWSVISL